MLKVVAQTKTGKLVMITVFNHPKPGSMETCPVVVTTVSGSIVKCPVCGILIQPELSIDEDAKPEPEVLISSNIIQPSSTEFVEYYIDPLRGEVGQIEDVQDANRKGH